MKVGVVGARLGMNAIQRQAVTHWLKNLYTEGDELHHGDCFGVDEEVADIAKSLGYIIVCHPPVNNSRRSFHESDQVRDPMPYFARNRNIVDETDFLMVIPYKNHWQLTGGTWYTHDYARKNDKELQVYWPILDHSDHYN